jgi:hypothetical protein
MMAERYAVTTGIWEAATFNGGTLPGVGDTVHANGYTVTVDQSFSVSAISTRPGTVAVAGGGFTFSTPNLNVSCDVYAGTTNCANYSASTGTLNLIGNLYTSNSTTSCYALWHTGDGSLVLTGNQYADSQSSSYGLHVTGSGTGLITGNQYGGTGTSCFGVRHAGSGLYTIKGHQYAGTTSSAHGLVGATGSLLIYGNSFGGDTAAGISLTSVTAATIYGDATGGIDYATPGLLLSGAANANVYLYGTARSSATGVGPGVRSSSTGTGCIIIQAAEQGAGGGWPIAGKVLFHDFNNIAFGVRNAANTLKTIGVLPHSSFSTPRAFT